MIGDLPTLDNEVIGLALTSTRNLRDLVSANVQANHFNNPVHGETWRIIQKLDAENQPVDPQTVYAARAEADGLVRSHIQMGWLFDCYQNAPIGPVAANRARLLREQYDHRETSLALTRSGQLLSEGVPAAEVRLQLMAALQEVTEDKATLTTLGDSIVETITGFDMPSKFTATPWAQLNKIIRGWRPGGLYVVGARPAAGKSLFLQGAAVALANTGPVLFEAMEMDHTEVTTRVLAQVSQVSQGAMGGLGTDGRSRLDGHQRDRVTNAAQRIEKLPLVYGHNAYTPASIREHARQLRARGPLAGIVIDYLQLMNVGYRIDNRVQEISIITRELKQMAGEFDCPVLLASQLSRAGVGRPELTHFRDSGSIEQDGDVLIGLYTGGEEQRIDGGLDLDAIVLKNRQGATATATLHRHGPTATIEDAERPPIETSRTSSKGVF